MIRLLSFILCGLIFGLGLAISGMLNPAKVLAFLDLFGKWDPSLAFVMGSAVIVTFVGYRLVWRRARPLMSMQWCKPDFSGVTPRLIYGSVIFGMGWGLVGLCPGPALTALTVGGQPALIFAAAMLAGIAASKLVLGRR